MLPQSHNYKKGEMVEKLHKCEDNLHLVKSYILDLHMYSVTLQRFLLCIPGGILGQELEAQALTVLYLENLTQQLKTLNQ